MSDQNIIAAGKRLLEKRGAKKKEYDPGVGEPREKPHIDAMTLHTKALMAHADMLEKHAMAMGAAHGMKPSDE